jgi:hypothetical protein
VEVMLGRAKVLCATPLAAAQEGGETGSYDGHLAAFAGCIVLAAKALCHDRVDAEATPEEDAHLAVLT